jgi:integrase/recombinase XerD
MLYGAGLRLGEALALNDADVDLQEAVLTIREAKFFKTRLVPIGQDLVRVLTAYRSRRELRHRGSPIVPFFQFRNGAPMNKHVVERTFCRLRAAANVQRDGGPRQQPRLHDLRHTAAVHRLLRWHQNGDDLQQQLPRLATYLGHKDLSATQRYLTLTPQLLRAASRRFERYAMENHYE